jgi:uncharacterized protein YeaO (DUF488 family)
MTMIQVKRVYEPQQRGDGTRFLVERLWPRGMKKEELHAKSWLREVAPSDELRRWFSHDPKKWTGFKSRYNAELDKEPEAWEPILKAAKKGNVTLLYSAHDREHNNAVALKAFLEKHL